MTTVNGSPEALIVCPCDTWVILVEADGPFAQDSLLEAEQELPELKPEGEGYLNMAD